MNKKIYKGILSVAMVVILGGIANISFARGLCHDFNVNLKIGDRGPEVKALQDALIKLGSEAWKYKGYDGVFDEMTAAEVVAFQERYRDEILTPLGLSHGTGFVGPSTRAKLNQLYHCTDLVPSESGVTSMIPMLVSPENGVTMDNGCVVGSDKIVWDFDWNDYPNATQYQLYVKNIKATVPLINEQYIYNSSYHFEYSGYVLNDYRYNWEWKVRAMVNNQWTNWSETRYFNAEPVNTHCNVVQTTTTTIKVLFPNGGEKWEVGKTYDITWTSVGVDKVGIALKCVSGPSAGSVISSITNHNEPVSASLGRYSWTSNFAFGSPSSCDKYKIIIAANGVATLPDGNIQGVYDESDNYFSIVAPTNESMPTVRLIDYYTSDWDPNWAQSRDEYTEWEISGLKNDPNYAPYGYELILRISIAETFNGPYLEKGNFEVLINGRSVGIETFYSKNSYNIGAVGIPLSAIDSNGKVRVKILGYPNHYMVWDNGEGSNLLIEASVKRRAPA